MQVDWSDFAWLVGIIEGEGYVTPRKFRQYHYPRIGLEMTCEDIVRRAARVAECGWVSGPRYRVDKKPQWKWLVTGTVEALDLLIKIRPYVGIKKGGEIDHFFLELEQENLLRVNGGRPHSMKAKELHIIGIDMAKRYVDGL